MSGGAGGRVPCEECLASAVRRVIGGSSGRLLWKQGLARMSMCGGAKENALPLALSAMYVGHLRLA